MARASVTSPEQLLAAITDLTEAQGYPPTLRELADYLGLKAVSSLYWTLNKLRNRGEVMWHPYKDRTLRVVHDRERNSRGV